MPYGITQCYLPPGRGDISAFTPAKAGARFSDSGGMQGWVVPGGWLEMVYPLNGHQSWTNRARCWLTSLMRPTTLITTPSRHPKSTLHTWIIIIMLAVIFISDKFSFALTHSLWSLDMFCFFSYRGRRSEWLCFWCGYRWASITSVSDWFVCDEKLVGDKMLLVNKLICVFISYSA